MSQTLLFESSIGRTAGDVIEAIRNDVAREGRRTGGSMGEPWCRIVRRLFAMLPGEQDREQARKALLAVYRQGGGE